jgi:hypothetical protein
MIGPYIFQILSLYIFLIFCLKNRGKHIIGWVLVHIYLYDFVSIS